MLRTAALITILTGLTAAQNQTIEWFVPGAEGSDLLASVVTANPSTTILHLSCPTNVDSSDCGFGPGLAFSIISTTIYEAVMSESDFTMSVSCEHNLQKSEMPCFVSNGGEGANDPGTTTETFSGSEIGFLTATVTAGAEKLSATASGAQSSDMVTSIGTSGSASAAKSPTASGASATASGSATGSAASASSTGAAYRFGVEGGALLALAGAAVVNAW
ncbi:uncharacterized protein BDR25DRAFT_308109 [Lindgomyces ingoldianus]|uniref:Uncharacterized protein n=1 Tax=Lindgomyces ingoldianus TaxID=673940 RepID=A0ACB6Q8C1_9PLEO|nr:uncharacterized protein BDR25DRAFT_308109 [Lindgomyces ingoldianus]KAF2462833.1 hypothetical protein BDR25DRAFT_308109 [Lindgomyces ingoldianus]